MACPGPKLSLYSANETFKPHHELLLHFLIAHQVLGGIINLASICLIVGPICVHCSRFVPTIMRPPFLIRGTRSVQRVRFLLLMHFYMMFFFFVRASSSPLFFVYLFFASHIQFKFFSLLPFIILHYWYVLFDMFCLTSRYVFPLSIFTREVRLVLDRSGGREVPAGALLHSWSESNNKGNGKCWEFIEGH